MPTRVALVPRPRAFHLSRRSIQDAAQRLAWRVEVLAVEQIIDANLGLNRQALPPMIWLYLPSEPQVKGKHVAQAFLTRWRGRNRPRNCALRDQPRLGAEPGGS